MEEVVIFKKVKELKVVPVIVIDDLDAALPLTNALIEGGLSIVEITFRTKVAAQVIHLISKEYPGLIIGAGTVLTIDNLKKAHDAGAKFAVAPGMNYKIVEQSLKMNMPFIPGVMTPSDIEAALNYNLKVLKFFPAEASGGISYFKNVVAPYTHTGIKFIPLGGININNFAEYLKLDQVIAIGGSWLATKQDIADKNWQNIVQNCKELISKMKNI